MSSPDRQALTYEVDSFLCLWNQRLSILSRFVIREAAASKLFTSLGEKSGIENSAEHRNRRGGMQTTTHYMPIKLVDEGFPTLWLTETYTENEEVLDLDTEVLRVRLRGIGGQILAVTSDSQPPASTNIIAEYSRDYIDALQRQLAGGPAPSYSPVPQIIGNHNTDGDLPLAEEQASYVSWLTRAAYQMEIVPPAELQ